RGCALDAAGNIYIIDAANRPIRRINSADGKISTIAGSGELGFDGDGGPAKEAKFNFGVASFITVDTSGNLYFADTINNRVRKITMSNGIVSTVAGTGIGAGGGDGNPPTNVNLFGPAGVAVNARGELFIADVGNNRVLRTKAAAGMRT